MVEAMIRTRASEVAKPLFCDDRVLRCVAVGIQLLCRFCFITVLHLV